MRICFVHQNMPAQYRYLIAALLQRGGQVLCIGEKTATQHWAVQHPNLGRLAATRPAQGIMPA